MVKRNDPKLLAVNGGHISLSKDWACYMLHCIGFVKRKWTTKGTLKVDNFAELKTEILFDIKVIVAMEEVPPSLVINWDPNSIKCVPVSNWTMAKQGVKKVEIVRISNKRQPPNCTGELQPMDISINKPVKDIMKNEFHQWHSDEVMAQGEECNAIKFPLSVVKPLGTR